MKIIKELSDTRFEIELEPHDNTKPHNVRIYSLAPGEKIIFKKDLKKHEGQVFTYIGFFDKINEIVDMAEIKEDNSGKIIRAHLSQLERLFKVNDVVVYHPFKTESFYDAKILEIKEGEDKPYLLRLGDEENIWAYPIEVQSIEETYPQRPLQLSDVKDRIDECFDSYSDEEVLEALEKHGAIENLDFKPGDVVYVYPNKDRVFKIMRIQEGTGDCELKDVLTSFKFGWISQEHLRLYDDMEEARLGQMKCPNCGLDMGTTGLSCMCGYNPKTGKVEKSPLLKDLIEKKELNLPELLRDCIGETFFSRSHGEVVLNKVLLESKDEYFLDFTFEGEIFLRFMSDGRRTERGDIDLWPSRELYEKYPLSPVEAWKEWERSGGKLKNEIEVFLKSCTLPDDIDDRCYSAARSGILMGLKLSAKYSEEEIKRILQ